MRIIRSSHERLGSGDANLACPRRASFDPFFGGLAWHEDTFREHALRVLPRSLEGPGER